MPMGLQTVEFIPNSLQDEWTKAWNDVQRMRDAARTNDEREMARLKWELWLPQGLLHAPSRGGQKGTRQFRELARRFVMWRHKDIMGLMKVWKGAVVAVKRKMSKAKARKERGDKSRIERAMRLLRHGAISRTGKALESMGLGDFEDPQVWSQISAKHPTRKRRIPETVYQFRSNDEIQLKVDKILPRLGVYAAPGP